MLHPGSTGDTEVKRSDSPPLDVDNSQTASALIKLGHALLKADYHWICPTPDTQALVNARPDNAEAADLAGVFGWNRPFHPDRLADALPEHLWQTLRDVGVLVSIRQTGLSVSRVRFSSFNGTLMVHSSWPTNQPDAVFFGPDTYRFGNFIADEMQRLDQAWKQLARRSRPLSVVDLGCGTGAGGIMAAPLLEPFCKHADGEGPQILFTDINPKALRFAKINAQLAGLKHFSCHYSDVLHAVADPVDLVLANPPYLLDPLARSYRHGGGELGTGLAMRMVEESLKRLAPGGTLLLYSAAPVVAGIDVFWQALQQPLARAVADRGAQHRYKMLDPDVFGSELAQPAYAEVERLAVVGLTITMPAPHNL